MEADGSTSEAPPISVQEVASKLGATSISLQRITLYLPDKDRLRNAIPNIKIYVDEAYDIFKELNLGVTVMQNLQGAWIDEKNGNLCVDETTTIVYSFIRNATVFRERIDKLLAFICRFGQGTNQGSVLLEFDNNALWIENFEIR